MTSLRALILFCFLSVWVTATPAQELKGFRLEVGTSAIDLDAGEAVEMTLSDGRKVTVKLTRNPFVRYAADGFSFVHPGNMSVAKSALGNGITQHLAASARGTVLLIQDYAKLNPSSLSQFMLQVLTNDAVRAGAEITQAPTTRKLRDGKILVGLIADVKTRIDKVQYEIDAYGSDDRGILAITILRVESESGIVAKFWGSLELKY